MYAHVLSHVHTKHVWTPTWHTRMCMVNACTPTNDICNTHNTQQMQCTHAHVRTTLSWEPGTTLAHPHHPYTHPYLHTRARAHTHTSPHTRALAHTHRYIMQTYLYGGELRQIRSQRIRTSERALQLRERPSSCRARVRGLATSIAQGRDLSAGTRSLEAPLRWNRVHRES